LFGEGRAYSLALVVTVWLGVWHARSRTTSFADARFLFVRLSARAGAAVTALAAATAEHVRADWWRGLTTDKVLGPELERFSAAVRQRFGDDIVRTMLWSRGDLAGAPSVPRQHQTVLATVSRTVHTPRQGERADDAERLTQRQTLGSRARIRP
jgi:hypothetical protein